ncbi:hypothetical protein Y032_0066g3762 [Ancylostoma ceylanicum]|uniref:Uncharacterized protein n=1 Tax=Ancylostoma ceylanicum TaxID=53326 RepID=A0A016U0Q1_9BILA|nr:hypothetical protein Y032_0066g3762 [Ancylostoma ceylanicum]
MCQEVLFYQRILNFFHALDHDFHFYAFPVRETACFLCRTYSPVFCHGSPSCANPNGLEADTQQNNVNECRTAIVLHSGGRTGSITRVTRRKSDRHASGQHASVRTSDPSRAGDRVTR